MDLIRDITFMLGTQGWQKLLDDEHVTEPPPDDLGDSQENPMDAIDRLVERFKTPLEGANSQLDEICCEFEAMVSYAGQFISLSTLDYSRASEQRTLWERASCPLLGGCPYLGGS